MQTRAECSPGDGTIRPREEGGCLLLQPALNGLFSKSWAVAFFLSCIWKAIEYLNERLNGLSVAASSSQLVFERPGGKSICSLQTKDKFGQFAQRLALEKVCKHMLPCTLWDGSACVITAISAERARRNRPQSQLNVNPAVHGKQSVQNLWH